MFIVSDIGIFVFCIQLFNAASSFDILICYLLKVIHYILCSFCHLCLPILARLNITADDHFPVYHYVFFDVTILPQLVT